MNDAPVSTNANFSTVVIDLDGTLHDDQRLLNGLDQAFLRYISTSSGLDAGDVARELGNFRNGKWMEVGSSPGEFAFIEYMGCSIAGWLDVAETATSLTSEIHKNPDLAIRLAQARPYFSIALATNSPWRLTSAILDRIGVSGLIDLVSCPRAPSTPVRFPRLGKPSVDLYRDVAAFFHVACSDVLVVGDRETIDLTPALAAGMQTKLIKGPAALTDVLSDLVARRPEMT